MQVGWWWASFSFFPFGSRELKTTGASSSQKGKRKKEKEAQPLTPTPKKE
jgi:hypothetical protein